MTPVGLPHSGIHGSKPAYDSPWHFAVNRALHRLLAPRHPPYALNSLTYRLATSRFTRNVCFEVNSFDFTSFFLYAVFKEQDVLMNIDDGTRMCLVSNVSRMTLHSTKNIGLLVKHFCFPSILL